MRDGERNKENIEGEVHYIIYLINYDQKNLKPMTNFFFFFYRLGRSLREAK